MGYYNEIGCYTTCLSVNCNKKTLPNFDNHSVIVFAYFVQLDNLRLYYISFISHDQHQQENTNLSVISVSSVIIIHMHMPFLIQNLQFSYLVYTTRILYLDKHFQSMFANTSKTFLARQSVFHSTHLKTAALVCLLICSILKHKKIYHL